MAIKADRQVDAVDITFFLNETAEKGVIVSTSTAGSGTSMDNPASVATVSANSSGSKVLGALLNDFVNVDQTRVSVNWHKDQSQIGNKCTILTKGWIVTNKVSGTTHTAGDHAVLTSSGSVTIKPAVASWNSSAQPFVGRFRGKADEDGYSKLYIDL